MNIREEARKAGGEALVAKVDAAKELEATILKGARLIIDEAMKFDKNESDEDRELTMIALCEAFSTAYAYVCVRHGDVTKASDGETLVSAVRSLSGNIEQERENLAAEKGGVAEKILEAARKPVEPKPEPKPEGFSITHLKRLFGRKGDSK